MLRPPHDGNQARRTALHLNGEVQGNVAGRVLGVVRRVGCQQRGDHVRLLACRRDVQRRALGLRTIINSCISSVEDEVMAPQLRCTVLLASRLKQRTGIVPRYGRAYPGLD